MKCFSLYPEKIYLLEIRHGQAKLQQVDRYTDSRQNVCSWLGADDDGEHVRDAQHLQLQLQRRRDLPRPRPGPEHWQEN